MTPADFRAIRATLGLSQSELARELGLSKSHVSHIEQGAAEVSLAVCKHLRLLLVTAERYGNVVQSPAGDR